MIIPFCEPVNTDDQLKCNDAPSIDAGFQLSFLGPDEFLYCYVSSADGLFHKFS